MIAVMKTDSGNFNIFGTRDGMFCLEGNLTLEEAKELQRELELAIGKD